jgi:hypothetical protein
MTDQAATDPAREDAKRAHDQIYDFSKQLNESVIKTGENTLRACLLINGGAAVSVLAFIGGLASKELIGVSQLAPVADSLLKFAFGVVAAVASMGLSYFVNYLTSMYVSSKVQTWDPPWSKPTKNTNLFLMGKVLLQTFAILCGLASMGLFLWGIYSVRGAIEHFPSPVAHTQAS